MGSKTVLILSLFFVVAGWASIAPAATCLPASDIKKIQSQFVFETWDANKKSWVPIADVPTCVTDDFTHRVFQAMVTLQQLPPLTSVTGALSFDVLGSSPLSFMKDHVQTIRLNTATEQTPCRGGVLAYVDDRKSKTIYVCPNSTSLTNLGLAATIVHEARHLDGSQDTHLVYPVTETVAHPHTTCLRGSYLKIDVCDDEFNGGSYGVQTEFYLKVAKTKAVPKSLRLEARGLAIIFLIERFNRLPFKLTDGALILSEDRRVLFYDGTDQPMVEIVPHVPEKNVVAVRNIPVLFDPEKATVKSYIGPEPLLDTPGVFSVAYRKNFTPSQRAGLLDAYYGSFQACYLFTRSLYCEVENESVVMPFPEGFKPLHFAIIPLFGMDIVFVVNDQFDLYAIPFKVPTKEWTLDRFEINPTLTKFKSVILQAGLFNIGIEPNGTLVRFENVKTRLPVAGYENQRFIKIIAPFS